MKRLWDLIRSLMTRERMAKVWTILFKGTVTVTASILTNEALMNAALEISLALLGLKSDTDDKAARFDGKMRSWCESNGVSAPGRADLNLVRELAYAAARAKTGG